MLPVKKPAPSVDNAAVMVPETGMKVGIAGPRKEHAGDEGFKGT